MPESPPLRYFFIASLVSPCSFPLKGEEPKTEGDGGSVAILLLCCLFVCLFLGLEASTDHFSLITSPFASFCCIVTHPSSDVMSALSETTINHVYWKFPSFGLYLSAICSLQLLPLSLSQKYSAHVSVNILTHWIIRVFFVVNILNGCGPGRARRWVWFGLPPTLTVYLPLQIRASAIFANPLHPKRLPTAMVGPSSIFVRVHTTWIWLCPSWIFWQEPTCNQLTLPPLFVRSAGWGAMPAAYTSARLPIAPA